MLESKEDVYVFCEKNISSYEMTIYTLAMAYAESPLFVVDDEMISDLTQLLLVDEELLRHALLANASFRYDNVLIKFGEKTINCTDYFDNTFFTSLIKINLAYKSLNKLSDKTDEGAIIENIKQIQSAIFYFDTINANNATYECMLEQQFSHKHTVYDSGVFPPMDYLDMLRTLVICDDCLGYDKSLLLIATHLARYELQTRLNTLYMVMITQIIMHSPFFRRRIS